jgi:cation diffusion facilitator CzcD-associated flavoprotein CzcO
LSQTADTRRFPRHQEVLRYIQAFARRFQLDGIIRLCTEVLAVSKDNDEGSSGGWMVRWRRNVVGDESEQEQEGEEVFDAVVVCNGHYTEPRTAADSIPGLDAWPPGKQMRGQRR